MIRNLVKILLALAISVCCVRAVFIERQLSAGVWDAMELRHVKYGLFNVDEWKRVVADIIAKKIDEVEITPEARPAMKRQVEDILHRVLDEVELVLNTENQRRGLFGWVRGAAFDLFDVMADVRVGIPRYADMLLDHMSDPKNKAALKEYLIARFNELADRTVGEVDYSGYSAVLERHASMSKEQCLERIRVQGGQWREEGSRYALAIVVLVLVLCAWEWLDRSRGRSCGVATVIACLALLCTGLSSPMIDIEATISSLSFTLVGEPVEFRDQVLFFESKSIGEVVLLLIRNGGIGLLFVALLVFCFSVVVPTAKIIASSNVLFTGVAPKTALGRFLVYKSGKWSMADVMVVAIFMSYIGFNGVINSQLTQIASLSSALQVFTTNNSELRMGFYYFLGYCILGLFLSSLLDKRVPTVVKGM